MFIPFSNWQPDSNPIAQEVLTDPTNNLVPTTRGYRGANAFYNVTAQTSLSATAVGMWYARRVDNTNLLFGGTPTNIYIRSGGGWTANTSVTISAVSRWQFAQYGNLTFAGAKETQSMVTDSTTFTSVGTGLTSMPRFAIIDTINEFVMLGNVTTSITYSILGAITVQPGDYQDRWWCSGIGNPLTWNPDLATQATTGRLTDVPGKLTAGRARGDRFAFYKQRGIYLGTNTSVPFVWEWSLISAEIGTFGQQCIVPVGNFHYFVGNSDFYIFDGQQAHPIGQGIREWFFSRMNKKYADMIWGEHDQYNKLIYWWYPGPTSSDGTLNEFVVYQYQTNKWGRGQSTMRAASAFFVDALTWDQLWVGYKFDPVPNTTFDSAVFQAESFVPVFFDEENRLSTLHGPHMPGTMVTTFGGDDAKASLLRRIRSRWITTPTTAVLTPSRLMRQGESATEGTPRTMQNARWDFTQNARWHKVKIDTTGNWETSGIDVEILSRGKE